MTHSDLAARFFIRQNSLLTVVFFLSGLSSLIYQVVWQRLLTLHYGMGHVSITLIVSIYMLGLGVGAYLGGILAERVKKRIRLYFLVELCLGLFGLISLPFITTLGHYTSDSSYLLSFFYIALFLCVPTVLMGITLPLLVKIYNRAVQNFLDSVSFLYFINTLGAAMGCLVAAYLIISFFGLDTGIYAAAAINFILAACIWLARSLSPGGATTDSGKPETRPDGAGLPTPMVYGLVTVTGFLAIGYEIAWFRVIGVLVKSSPYAFATILSVYLTGVALGSFGMNLYRRKKPQTDFRKLFFIFQFLLGLWATLSVLAYYLGTKHTVFAIFTSLSFDCSKHPSFYLPAGGLIGMAAWFKFFYGLTDVVLWSLYFIFVPTLFMGASFPLISHLALKRPDQEGGTVGRVYYFTILGNLAGGLVTGLVLLPLWSTETTLLVFGLVGLAFIIYPVIGISRFRAWILAGAGVYLVLVLFLFPGQGDLYRVMHGQWQGFKAYLQEGMNGVVMTFNKGDKITTYIGGVEHGGRHSGTNYGWWAETLLPVSYARQKKNVLVIGYGTGSYMDGFLSQPRVERLTLVEISETLLTNQRKVELMASALADPRVEIVIDDCRRYLLRTDSRFDIIIMDPLRSYTAYSNNIHSQEFFELISNHLSPGGIFAVWRNEKRVIPHTLASVFKKVRIYPTICLGSMSDMERPEEWWDKTKISYPPEVRAKMGQYFTDNAYQGDGVYVDRMFGDFPTASDLKPVSEYHLGLKWLIYKNRNRARD